MCGQYREHAAWGDAAGRREERIEPMMRFVVLLG
jgi:hypothetical protein